MYSLLFFSCELQKHEMNRLNRVQNKHSSQHVAMHSQPFTTISSFEHNRTAPNVNVSSHVDKSKSPNTDYKTIGNNKKKTFVNVRELREVRGVISLSFA
jgi:hypothetical protein